MIASDRASRWRLVACYVGLFLLTLLVSNYLQSRLTRHLVGKVVASQRQRVEWNVERFDTTLRLAEASIRRYARLVSYGSSQLSTVSDSLQGVARLDGDGVWRTDKATFDPATQAGVWIPPTVSLNADTRRFFVRTRQITSLFGQGAEDPLIANTWALPSSNGEVIYWPDDKGFIYRAGASLDYRSTPWVQLTNPRINPSGEPRWTEPDYDPAAERWLISVVAPFQRDGRWAGSVGHDILIGTLLSNLVDDASTPMGGSRDGAIASAPLYVARLDGQLFAKRGSEPHRGERLPLRLMPYLRTNPGKKVVQVYANGADYVIAAPLPALGARVLYLVEGSWIDSILRDELLGLQIAEALFISLLLGSGLALGLRDAQFRRRQQALLENRNRDLQKLVHERTIELEVASTRLRQEVLLASQIQRNLLVSEREIHQVCPGLEVGLLMVPSKEVGGDLYDVIPLTGSRQVIAIGDVAGKGMPAALLMSTCLSLLRSYVEVLDSPSAIMRRLNQRLCHRNDDCAFTTLVIAVLDSRSGELRWCNAGHVPLLIVHHNGERVQLRTVHGPALGVQEGAIYGESRLNLAAHDTLLGWTDGASDMADPDGQRFGLARLESITAGQVSLSPPRLVRFLMRELRLHAAGEPQRDDITLIAFRRRITATAASVAPLRTAGR